MTRTSKQVFKMKNECENDSLVKFSSSPKFAKTAQEWILASALYDGIEDEDIRQIEMLVSERGANPNVLLPEYGISPFHLVVANESTSFALHATDLCLQHGADPNVRSEDGLTPVHLAAMWGCSEVLHLLLASGGNPWLVDDLGLNAFDYATRERQQHCYQILKAYCNSQPKQSGYRRSPYQLNLKRVILYKNDLQIVYEASPTNGQQTSSTQTCPDILKNRVLQTVPDSSLQKTKSPSKGQEDSALAFKGKDKLCQTSGKIETPISSKLKEIIEKHRGNSVLFEYSPIKENKDVSRGVNSWEGVDQSKMVMTGFSELVSKLDETNKFRQSLKASDNTSDLLKNITQRKVPCATPKPFVAPKHTSIVSENSSFCNKSCQYEVPPNEIGFILDDTTANSTTQKDRNASLDESPPSIGFILDNLSNMCNGQDSSLFSDIASDIDVFSTPVHNDNGENVLTEDEKPPEVKVFTENSSSDSLHPYVSCDNTRGRESNEEFASCRGRESNEEFASCRNSQSFIEGSTKKQEPPAIVDALNDYFEKHSRTPVNSEVITSTPEKSGTIEDNRTRDVDLEVVANVNVTVKSPKRLSAGSDESSASPQSIQQNDREQMCVEPSTGKLSWVEARVVSSDEEQYMSISEEYEYTDMDEGVVLIEKRYLTKDISIAESDSETKAMARESSSSECESVSTVSGSEGAYDTDELRRALVQHGFVPGPITGHTKRVYLRKLKRCRRKPLAPPPQDGAAPGEGHCPVM